MFVAIIYGIVSKKNGGNLLYLDGWMGCIAMPMRIWLFSIFIYQWGISEILKPLIILEYLNPELTRAPKAKRCACSVTWGLFLLGVC
jgi:hypothetical protein